MRRRWIERKCKFLRIPLSFCQRAQVALPRCQPTRSALPGRVARQKIMGLCPLVSGLRALDGGPLSNARIVEDITALIIGLNVRHKAPDGLGIRFTGLPE